MNDTEDREQQAGITRLLLYYLNAPIAEGCRLRGVLPASGAVRVAIRAGDGENGDLFLYEIPHDTVAPARIPGVLRAVLSGTQIYGSGDVSDVLGMTLVRLRPEEITPAPEPEEGQALRTLLGLSAPGDDEDPFLVGFLMKDGGLMRLYVNRPGRPGLVGVDIRLTDEPTALTASLPTLVEEEERHRLAPDDPHCDVVVDLTDW
ncbi:hypothetical protein OG709_10490 [Streptomyces sp. NBC_01267]|uniref:hypothetical protein n=1 Tax=unclassified Streptomyces TaxID=2593676 RepID=UPI002DD86E65|nr:MULTISPECIES: hypothetical protein [unclassified Streptomyces]WSC22643.1 hypothetical protein OIE60_24855 [Streptomyces sp. NBC_01766]WSV56487.1 hypothetical protein OG282_23930 [Streptomyces sp. NBC_01014]